MRTLIATAAAALTLAATATAAAADTPLEQRRDGHPVMCVSTISRWVNSPTGPVVHLWYPYCQGISRSIRLRRHLDAAVVQGWAIYTSILIDIAAARGGESDGLGAADTAVVPLAVRSVLRSHGIRGRYLNRLEAHVRLTVAESQQH